MFYLETPGLVIKGDSYLKSCRTCAKTWCSALPEGLGAQLSRPSCGRKCPLPVAPNSLNTSAHGTRKHTKQK